MTLSFTPLLRLKRCTRVTNDIPLGVHYLLPIHTVHCVETLKVRVLSEATPSWDPSTEEYGRYLNFSDAANRSKWVSSAATTLVNTGLDGW
jgi:hypothetical protein